MSDLLREKYGLVQIPAGDYDRHTQIESLARELVDAIDKASIPAFGGAIVHQKARELKALIEKP